MLAAAILARRRSAIAPALCLNGASGSRIARVLALGLAVLAGALLPNAVAFAAEQAPAGPSEALFLTQIVLPLLVARLLGEVMQRVGQPAVMGQLIAGIILGPSVFGALLPQAQHAIFAAGPEQRAMIEAVSDLGILLLLLLTGMDTDLKLVRRTGRAAASVSAAGMIVPFACGFALGQFLPEAMMPRPDQRLITSLFIGIALSVASVKIVAMVVRDMNFMRRKIGMILVASAIIDDTVGWTIIAITSSLALHGVVSMASLVRSVLGTALFLLASFTVGRRLVFGLIRWTNDMFVSEAPVITAILIVMGVMALTTNAIGIHTVLGAFVAGILIGESPILSRHIGEQLRGLVVGLFMPVFFALAGLHSDLSVLKNPQLILLALGLIAIASIGKFSGAFLGGAAGGLNRRESLALACGMNARGSTEVIVATIGLSLGVISQDLFTMIVAMAIVTTLAMPPMLRWALARLPMQEEERARLEREELERTGFITNVERLLVAVDDSVNGKLALRLAGLIAGSRGITTTVLQLGHESAEARVKAAIAATGSAAPDPDGGSRKVHLTLRTDALPAESAVSKELQKGYGLLIVGIANTIATHGGFHNQVSSIAGIYEGPLAVVVARGAHVQSPEKGGMNILVPVRGNQISRRAAEVALALTRAGDRLITAFYVLSTTGLGSPQRRFRRPTRTHRHEEAVLKDIVELADRHGQSIRTALRLDVAPEDAILRQARLGQYNLIVMGVGRPSGEILFFGKIAAAVLERCDCSILFVSS